MGDIRNIRKIICLYLEKKFADLKARPENDKKTHFPKVEHRVAPNPYYVTEGMSGTLSFSFCLVSKLLVVSLYIEKKKKLDVRI